MRIARSLSLTSRYGTSSDLLGIDQQIDLRPEKVFSGNGAFKYKRPQRLDWFQDAWKNIGETSRKSRDDPSRVISRSKSSRALKRYASSSKQKETSAAIAVTDVVPRRSRSLTQSRGDLRGNKKVSTRGHTTEQHLRQGCSESESHRSNRVRVEPDEQRMDAAKELKRTVSGSTLSKRKYANGKVRNQKAFWACSASNCGSLDGLHPTYFVVNEEPAASRGHRTKGSERVSSGRKMPESSERRSARSSKVRDITITPNELNLVALKDNSQLSKEQLVSSEVCEEGIRGVHRKMSKTFKSEKLKKQLRSRMKAQNSWNNTNGDDQPHQCVDLKPDCTLGLGPKPEEYHSKIAAQVDDRKKELENLRKKARESWKALTEREKKLDRVRKNARDIWKTLAEKEQEDIDFVLAALESTKLPDFLTKPFDWIKNEALLEERVVSMTIMRNESAVALLDEQHRIPSPFLGDRAVVHEYIRNKSNCSLEEVSGRRIPRVPVVVARGKAGNSLNLEVKKNSSARDVETMMFHNTMRQNKKASSDGDESVSSTAINLDICDDDTLSTYHNSDSGSLPSIP